MSRRRRQALAAAGVLVALLLALWLVTPPSTGPDVPDWAMPEVAPPPEIVAQPAPPPVARPSVRRPDAVADAEVDAAPRPMPMPVALPEPGEEPEETTEKAYLAGQVTGIGDGEAWVEGCGGRATVDADGAFFREIEPQPCEVRAARRDGAFTVRGEPVRIEPQPGEELDVRLSLPAYKGAGVGARVHEHELGIRISSVMDGSPAQQAGLQDGDIVIAVNGVDTVDLGLKGFVDQSVGPAGSNVSFKVLRDGEEWNVSLTREQRDGS